jgi:hypothetical protein
MMGVAFATKRLWIRRSKRTWLLTNKVFGAVAYMLPPLWAFWFYRWWFRSWKNTGSDAFIGGLIVNVVLAIVIPTFMWQAYLGRDATVDELRKARAADGCFDDTIVRRAASWNRPVTVRDVRLTQDDCAEMWAEIARKKVQAAALSKQLEK